MTGFSKQHVCNPSKNSSSICCFAFQHRPRRPTSRSRCEDGLTVLETVVLCKYLEGLLSAAQLQPHAHPGLTAICPEASFFGELRQDVAQDKLKNSKVEAMHPIVMHAINMEPGYREQKPGRMALYSCSRSETYVGCSRCAAESRKLLKLRGPCCLHAAQNMQILLCW